MFGLQGWKTSLGNWFKIAWIEFNDKLGNGRWGWFLRLFHSTTLKMHDFL